MKRHTEENMYLQKQEEYGWELLASSAFVPGILDK